MKIKVKFKANNGFKPYSITGDAAWNLCREYGPTLYPIYIGGVNPIYPLPEQIETDMMFDEFFKIFRFKSVRLEIDYNNTIILTVPGYREEWIS